MRSDETRRKKNQKNSERGGRACLAEAEEEDEASIANENGAQEQHEGGKEEEGGKAEEGIKCGAYRRKLQISGGGMSCADATRSGLDKIV